MTVIQCVYCGKLYSDEFIKECPNCDNEGDEIEGFKELEF